MLVGFVRMEILVEPVRLRTGEHLLTKMDGFGLTGIITTRASGLWLTLRTILLRGNYLVSLLRLIRPPLRSLILPSWRISAAMVCSIQLSIES